MLGRSIGRGWMALVALAAVALAAACTTETQVTLTPDQPAGISVSGTGRVRVRPDVAKLDLGVEARQPTVAEAREQAASTMNDLMASLAENGIDERDIQTRFVSIHPEFRFDRENDEQRITGFVVNNRVRVTIRDLDSVSEVVDDAVAAAGDNARVNGLTFEVEDPEAVLDQARAEAIEDARRGAQQLADAAGVTLGAVRSIAESTGGSPPIPLFREGAAQDEAATPISPGENELELRVSVVFEIE